MFEDILRFAQPALIWILGATLFVFVATQVIISVMKRSNVESKTIGYVKWVRNILLLLLIIAFVWQLGVALSINAVDRSVIDRDGIDFSRYPTATPFK
ncbi:MAG: hypothetical protein UT26_C0036G0016 [Microgenomates group bacterium GW2011_GWC1_39_12]|nr:MAG: hypothetical protein UT26_C0036G0016 [Microgenomates group bacterium GW2011_GWC1_39_12]